MRVNFSIRHILAIQAVIAILVFFAYCRWRDWNNGWTFREVVQIPFDEESWRNANLEAPPPTVRSQMIEDLLRSYNFIGWTRDEVERLLGKPLTGELVRFDIVYFVGPDREIGIDGEWLVFILDSAGRVSKFSVLVE